MFLIYYFLFLNKTYNNQKQKGFIICQKQPLELFHKKRCLSLFLIKLQTSRLVVFWLLLRIFKSTKEVSVFFFVFISFIEHLVYEQEKSKSNM